MALALGDLPLALAQAAGYMASTGTPTADYLELLAARAAQILLVCIFIDGSACLLPGMKLGPWAGCCGLRRRRACFSARV